MIDATAQPFAVRVVATLVLAAVVTIGASCEHRPDVAHEQAHESSEGSPAESRTSEHPHRLVLGADAAAHAGIRVAIAAAAEGIAEVEAFGRVLDPVPMVAALHARDAAKATLDVARTEHERVARLHGEGQNASTRDLEAARAALDKARLDYADATARLHLSWGAAADGIANVADDLTTGRAAVVRIDLPAGARVTPPPTSVRVAGVAHPDVQTGARVLGPAPTVDPMIQGDAYLALVTDDAPRPGAVLAVAVPRDAAPQSGIAVPDAAIVWVEGRAAVYVEATAGEFERRRVTLGPREDDRWIVTDGVAPGEHLVIAGTARLLAADVMTSESAAAAD